MAKTLKDFLELYKPKAADEQKFVDKHVVAKTSDRNGNGDDVFAGAKVKKVDRKKEAHGHEPGEDEKVYEEVEQIDEISASKVNKYREKAFADTKKDRSKGRELAFKKIGAMGKGAVKVPATEEVESVEERQMTPAEMQKKEKLVKAMKPASEWEKRYPGRGKEVMYATATKKAMEEVEPTEEVESIEEKAGYSAKAAAAGKDIGKKGKQFSKIAASAAKKYGSKAAGERVAGAVLKKLRAEEKIEDLLSSLNESNKTLMLKVFGKLTEENQEKFVEAIENDGLDEMLDFAIKNRNLE